MLPELARCLDCVDAQDPKWKGAPMQFSRLAVFTIFVHKQRVDRNGSRGITSQNNVKFVRATLQHREKVNLVLTFLEERGESNQLLKIERGAGLSNMTYRHASLPRLP